MRTIIYILIFTFIGTETSVYDTAEKNVKNLDFVGFALAGLFVGFGTKLGNGCTSGHGVCGMPR